MSNQIGDKTNASVVTRRAQLRTQAQDRKVKKRVKSRWRRPQSPWPFILGLLVVILVIGSAVAVGNRRAERTTKAAPAKASSQTNSARTTRAVRAKRTPTAAISPSSRRAANFPQAAVKADVDASLTALGGQSAVAVLPVSGRGRVVTSEQSQRAASVIKLFILVTVYQQVERGQLDLDATYTLKSQDQVGGSGTLQSLPAGSRLSYREITRRMMDVSDNTGANIMIHAVGGRVTVNAEIKRLGLTHTQLVRYLMDTQALQRGHDNVTSVTDVAVVLKKLYNHDLISQTADDAMLAILKANTNHDKLPRDLPSDAVVYNKSGEYDQYGVQNDAAVIANQKGAFVVVVLSQNGQTSQQVAAMNRLGTALYQTLLGANTEK